MTDAAPRRRRGPGSGPGKPVRDPDPNRMPPEKPNGNGGGKKPDDDDRVPEVPDPPPIIPPPIDRPPAQT